MKNAVESTHMRSHQWGEYQQKNQVRSSLRWRAMEGKDLRRYRTEKGGVHSKWTNLAKCTKSRHLYLNDWTPPPLPTSLSLEWEKSLYRLKDEILQKRNLLLEIQLRQKSKKDKELGIWGKGQLSNRWSPSWKKREHFNDLKSIFLWNWEHFCIHNHPLILHEGQMVHNLVYGTTGEWYGIRELTPLPLQTDLLGNSGPSL